MLQRKDIETILKSAYERAVSKLGLSEFKVKPLESIPDFLLDFDGTKELDTPRLYFPMGTFSENFEDRDGDAVSGEIHDYLCLFYDFCGETISFRSILLQYKKEESFPHGCGTTFFDIDRPGENELDEILDSIRSVMVADPAIIELDNKILSPLLTNPFAREILGEVTSFFKFDLTGSYRNYLLNSWPIDENENILDFIIHRFFPYSVDNKFPEDIANLIGSIKISFGIELDYENQKVIKVYNPSFDWLYNAFEFELKTREDFYQKYFEYFLPRERKVVETKIAQINTFKSYIINKYK